MIYYIIIYKNSKVAQMHTVLGENGVILAEKPKKAQPSICSPRPLLRLYIFKNMPLI